MATRRSRESVVEYEKSSTNAKSNGLVPLILLLPEIQFVRFVSTCGLVTDDARRLIAAFKAAKRQN